MPDPNLHQLRIFATVARLGSFSRAAKELSITQPAVSVQVQEVEKAFGTQLLQRLGKRPVPTEAGLLVLRYAKEIFNLVEELNIGIAELRGFQRGTVLVGACSSMLEYVLPPMVARFHEEYPGLSVQLRQLEAPGLIAELLAGEVALGFAVEPPPNSQITALPIGQDDLVVIAPPAHRYRDRRGIPAQALRGDPWVLREPGAEGRIAVDKATAQRGFDLTPAYEMASNEAVKRAVSAGLGVALVPRIGITLELAAGSLIVLDVPDLVIKRTLAVLYHRQHRLNRAETALVSLAQHWNVQGSLTARA